MPAQLRAPALGYSRVRKHAEPQIRRARTGAGVTTRGRRDSHAGGTRRARSRTLSEPELLERLERLTDPGALVLARLQALRLHEGIRVLVPAAVREVVPKYGGRGLGLLDDAERHIRLREPQQGLFDVARSLIARDYDLEAVDRAGVGALVQQLAP